MWRQTVDFEKVKNYNSKLFYNLIFLLPINK